MNNRHTTSLGTPLQVGDAGHGRGVEILDRDGLTVANGLPWARDEIVRIVNAHDAMLDALREIANHVDSILTREPVDGRISLFAADRNALESRLYSTRKAIAAATGEKVNA